LKAKLGAYLDKCETKGPVVITRNGKAVAVLVAPADDDDLERLLLSRSAQFQAILKKSRKSMRAGKGTPAKQFWRIAGTK
jgi:prevent-host-death family protein